MTACEICQEIVGLPGREFVTRAGPGAPRALRVDERVAIMPSLAPLADVHALVMPTEHVLSSSASEREVRDAVWRVAEDLRRSAITAGYSTVIFEHGQTREGRGCGTSHAHVHVLAVLGPHSFALPSGEWHRFSARSGYLRVDPAKEHLLISLCSSSWALRYETGVRSQYLRRWIAGELGLAHWDWRQPTYRDKSLRAQSRLIADLMPTTSPRPAKTPPANGRILNDPGLTRS